MKRDLDVVREFLLKIEAAPRKLSSRELTTNADEARAELILRHLQMVEEAGLIKGILVHLAGHRLPDDIELTWGGHDFIDATREPSIWQKTKSGAEATGAFTFGTHKSIVKRGRYRAHITAAARS